LFFRFPYVQDTDYRLPGLVYQLLHGYLLSYCFHTAKLERPLLANEKSGIIGHLKAFKLLHRAFRQGISGHLTQNARHSDTGKKLSDIGKVLSGIGKKPTGIG